MQLVFISTFRFADAQRKSIGEVRGIRRTLVQEFTNEADAFSD